MSWLTKRLGPPAKEVQTAEELAAFIEGNKIAVIGFFESSLDADFKAYEAVALAVEGVAFAYSTVSALAAGGCASATCLTIDAAPQSRASRAPRALCCTSRSTRRRTCSRAICRSRASRTSLRTTASRWSLPSTMRPSRACSRCAARTRQAVADAAQSKVPVSTILFTETGLPELQEVAEAFRGKVVFATVGSNEPRLNDYLGVKPSDFPKFYLIVRATHMLS